MAGLPPTHSLPVPNSTPGWRDTVRVMCLAQEHNTMSRAQTRTARSGDEKAKNDAIARPHLSLQVYMYGLLTKCEVKMAGYWPSSFFACLWTETKSRSINSQKKNKANIQPS